jgi:hypothetical protein
MPDFARLYMQKQANQQTLMIFVTAEGEIEATILEYGKFEHLLRIDGEPTPVKKLTLLYHYKQIDDATVAEKIGVDEAVRVRNEPMPPTYKERHLLPNSALWKAKKQGNAARFTMRSGDVFTGMIDWFGPFEVKLSIAPRGEDDTASVILHRHAALSVDLLEDPPSDDEDA